MRALALPASREGMAGWIGWYSQFRPGARVGDARACISRFHRVQGRRGGGERGEIVSVSQRREGERERQGVTRVRVCALIVLAWARVIWLCHTACRMSILTRTSFSTSHRPPRPIPGESTFNVPHRPRSSLIENSTPRSALGSGHGFAYHSFNTRIFVQESNRATQHTC